MDVLWELDTGQKMVPIQSYKNDSPGAKTKISFELPGLLLDCQTHWICVVVFLLLAASTSSCSALRLYKVMITDRLNCFVFFLGLINVLQIKSPWIKNSKYKVVYSSRCPVNSFIDVSFTMAVHGKHFFCCNTASGHLAKLAARLSGGALSSSYSTLKAASWLHC